MSPKSNAELKRSMLQLERLVDMGPAPSREAVQIAEKLLDTLSEGFQPDSRVSRLAASLRALLSAWFGDDATLGPEAVERQRIALHGGIEQLVGLVAAKVMN
jgi:hypothetical protein